MPKLGTCGSSCKRVPMPCPTNSLTTLKPLASTCCCTAAPTSPTAFPIRACSMPLQRGFSHFEQLLQFRRELAIYRDGYRRVSVVTVKHYAAINRNNVARLQYPLGGRDPVHNFFLDRSTEHAGIIVISLERRFRAQIFNLLFG